MDVHEFVYVLSKCNAPKVEVAQDYGNFETS